MSRSTPCDRVVKNPHFKHVYKQTRSRARPRALPPTSAPRMAGQRSEFLARVDDHLRQIQMRRECPVIEKRAFDRGEMRKLVTAPLVELEERLKIPSDDRTTVPSPTPPPTPEEPLSHMDVIQHSTLQNESPLDISEPFYFLLPLTGATSRFVCMYPHPMTYPVLPSPILFPVSFSSSL